MKLEELKGLPAREFTDKLFMAFREKKITAEQMKQLSKAYLKANNNWRER